MPATVITTVRGTGTLNTEDRRVRDVTPGIIKLEGDAGPLTTLLAQLRKSQTDDPRIEWFEDELLPRFDTLGDDLTAGAATMTVSNFARFRRGDLVQIADKEIVRVTATPTTSSVSISRGKGIDYAAGVAATSADRLRIISGSHEEGDTRRALLTTQKVNVFNFCQIFKNPFGVTRTAAETKTFAGKDMVEEEANALIEHKKDIEMSFLIGDRVEDATGDTGTHPQRHTRGLLPYIDTNVFEVNGPLGELDFEKFLIRPFRYGTSQKVMLNAPIVSVAINGWARGKLQLAPEAKKYGVSLSDYMTAGKRLLINTHQLMTNDSMTDITGLATVALILDIKDLKLRYVGPRMTMLKTNIQANDQDGRIDQYLSEVGLEAHQERMHGVLKGVTG